MKMRIGKSLGATVMATVIATVMGAQACSSVNGADPQPGSSLGAGSVGMQLIVHDGVSLTHLAWSIADADGNVVLTSGSPGHQPWVGAASSAVSFVIGGVPQGRGYRITLDGADSSGDSCSGSAIFDVTAGSLSRASVNVVCVIPNHGGTAADVTTGSLLVNGSVTLDAGAPAACPGISSLSVSPAAVVDGQSAALAVETVGPGPSGVVWSAEGGLGEFSASTSPRTTFLCNGFVGTTTVTAIVSGASGCVGLPFTTASAPVTCEALPTVAEAGAPEAGETGDANGTIGDSSTFDTTPDPVCVDGTMPSPAGIPILIDMSSGTPVVSSPGVNFWATNTSVSQSADGAWAVTIGLVGAYRGTSYSNRGVELRSPATGDLVLSYGIDTFSWIDSYSQTTISSTLYVLDGAGHLAGRTPRINNAVVPQMCLVPQQFQLAVPGITTEWDVFDIYIRAQN